MRDAEMRDAAALFSLGRLSNCLCVIWLTAGCGGEPELPTKPRGVILRGGTGGTDGAGGSGNAAGAAGAPDEVGGAAGAAPDDELGEPGCAAAEATPAPTVLSDVEVYAYALAVEDGYVYFASIDHIGWVPADGGTPGVVAEGLLREDSLVVRDGKVYFSAYEESAVGDIFEVSTEGGAPELIGPGAGAVRAGDATKLYSITGNQIWTTGRDGQFTGVFSEGDFYELMADVVIDETTLYSIAFTPLSDIGGKLRSIPLEGGEVTLLAEIIALPHSLAVDASAAYVAARTTDNAGSRVLRVPFGGEAEIFAHGGGDLGAGIAVDAEAVYFLDQTESDEYRSCIKRKPLAGGAPVVLASWPGNGYALTSDATHLYVSDGAVIMRVPKPAERTRTAP